MRSFLEEALDPREDLGNVDTLQVADAAAVDAVDVRDVRVDAKDSVGPAEEIRTAGVAEAQPSRALAGIERKPQSRTDGTPAMPTVRRTATPARRSRNSLRSCPPGHTDT
jgi:hypothetical protein